MITHKENNKIQNLKVPITINPIKIKRKENDFEFNCFFKN
jgi:hypothetical protein